jgi:hypothetical protein
MTAMHLRDKSKGNSWMATFVLSSVRFIPGPLRVVVTTLVLLSIKHFVALLPFFEHD